MRQGLESCHVRGSDETHRCAVGGFSLRQFVVVQESFTVSTPKRNPPRRSDPDAGGPRRVELAIAVMMCLAGLWFLLGQLVAGHFKVVPGDLGDSRFNAIVLEHGFRYLRGDAWHHPYWSPRWSFFPHKNVLAYSDNLLGTLPLYVILRVFGLSELSALNAWLVVISIANYIAMYLLLRAVSLSRIGAALGGFLFAFAMPRGEQLNHLQLFPQFFTPLCFLCLVKMRSLRPWTVWATFSCVVLQLYAAVYLGWFLALALGIGATVMLAMCLISTEFRHALRDGLKQLWVHLIAALVVSIVALLPMGIHYARAQAEVGPRKYDEIREMLPRMGSYFLPADYTFVYRWMLKIKANIPVAHEQAMFAGYLALICVILLLCSICKRTKYNTGDWWKYVFVAIWLTTVTSTLWINGSLWGYLHRVVPGGGAIRAVSRIVLLQLLPLGAAVAWVATWLEKRSGWAVAALFATLIVFENSGLARYHFAIRRHYVRVSRIQSELARKECAKFLVAGKDEAYKIQLDAMWASLQSKIPTINGLSGNAPPKWPLENLKDVRETEVRVWLRRHFTRNDRLCILSH